MFQNYDLENSVPLKNMKLEKKNKQRLEGLQRNWKENCRMITVKICVIGRPY